MPDEQRGAGTARIDAHWLSRWPAAYPGPGRTPVTLMDSFGRGELVLQAFPALREEVDDGLGLRDSGQTALRLAHG
ncbi:hypothetical protein Acy02nite_61000 [Actinoplanes cyaneus]|uniref:Uncharacterized protein n=1 Tax=Actinoplanes cyaneus TaxID=52696 RepID=A0A919ILS4_9ACTN|nr:hypothetical protein [Actinoplanes cyaneus]GID68219.1 hypothetical protein Acy02nite_61000 [Actinoplanes cyaneus]